MLDKPYGPFFVPNNFTKATSNGGTFDIQKGQLNKIRLRPQVLNEHAESSRNIIGTVSSGNIVGQIFKASKDNINGIDLTLQSAAITSFDDFEEYADDTALQVAWVATGARAAVLNTVLVSPETSTKSMQLSGSSSDGDEWVKTVAATDFAGATGSIRFRATADYSNIKLRFFIGDGTNTKSGAIVQSGANIWEKIEISEQQLEEDQAGITDSENITKVGFRVEKKNPGEIMYVDTMVSAPPPGSVEIKIYDHGATLPVSGTATLDGATQYDTIGDAGISGLQEASYILKLEGGFRSYHIERFVCGVAEEIPDNVKLTPGNYYSITLTWVDTNVSVYGPNPEWDDYYSNGYSFTAPDETTAITATGENEDIMFCIYSTQDVYISGFQNFADHAPNGNSKASLYVENENMIRTDVLITGVKPPQVVQRELSVPILLPKGGKIEQEYNDDFTDNVSKITFLIIYYYEPQEVNG